MSNNSLSFNELRRVCQCRAEEHNVDGDGLSHAVDELVGEVGEACNAVKKLEQARIAVADEMADVVISVDLVCQQLGIDLGEAVTNEFNKTSEKLGSDNRVTKKRAGCLPRSPSGHILPPNYSMDPGRGFPSDMYRWTDDSSGPAPIGLCGEAPIENDAVHAAWKCYATDGREDFSEVPELPGYDVKEHNTPHSYWLVDRPGDESVWLIDADGFSTHGSCEMGNRETAVLAAYKHRARVEYDEETSR